jgi:Skp family chaperone for outer membrane proteins
MGTLLMTGTALAQTPPAQTPPPQTPPPQTPPAQAQPAPVPPQPFPEGSKIAYVNIQLVASSSAQGKAYSARIQAMQQTELTAAKQKLQQGATVLSDAARIQLEKDIERMTRELQFLTQDAQAQVQDLQTDLQSEFQKLLEPVIEKVAVAKGLHMVFSVGDSGLVWAYRGLDITTDIIAEFDAIAAKPKAPGGGQ